jgi:hypothetical protein
VLNVPVETWMGNAAAVLSGAWVRVCSVGEGVNRVVRMHQGRHRHVSQGLRDFKRLYWRCHGFREGKRQGQRPYDLLGLPLPRSNGWQRLQMAPEESEQKLFTQQVGT